MKPGLRTASQNRAIHALLGKLRGSGRTAEEAAAFLATTCRAASGQDRSSLLTEPQARHVLAALAAEAARFAAPTIDERRPWGPRGDGPREAVVITPAQQQMLQGVLKQAGMVTAEQQQGFARRQCGHPWPQSQADFDAIVEACKAIITRALDRDDLVRRLTVIQAHAGLTAWERDWVADVMPRVKAKKSALSPGRLAKLLEIEGRLGV